MNKEEHDKLIEELRTTTNIIRYIEINEELDKHAIDCSPLEIYGKTKNNIFKEIKEIIIRATIKECQKDLDKYKNNIFTEFGELYKQECERTDKIEEIRRKVMNNEQL